MKKLLTITILFLVFFNLSAQNSCSWTRDNGKSAEENLKDLLQCLVDGESDTIMQDHFRSILAVCNHPDASFSQFETETNSAITFLSGDGKNLSTYMNNAQPRQLIRAFTSPSDGFPVWYRLGLPSGWDISATDYPMLLELHGRGTTNNPLKMLLGGLQNGAPSGSVESYRGDGYHLIPWGRGDRDYEGQAGKVIFELMDDFDSRFETNPVQQYIYGFSMGGGGTYKIAKESMNRWAALGMFSPALFDPDFFEAERFKHKPLWHFWGDSEVYKILSQELKEYFLIHGMDIYDWNEEVGWGHNYNGTFQTEMLNFMLSYSKGTPYMDIIGDQEPFLTGSGQHSILLTGIGDGNEGTQSLTITATTAQPGNIEIDSVSYSGSDTARLYFKPLAESMAPIRIKIQDDGGTAYNVRDTAIYNFSIGIFDQVNNNPSLTIPEMDTLLEDIIYTFTISGISDGDGSAQNLSFSTFSVDSITLPKPIISYTQGADTAVMTVQSGENLNGSNFIRITLEDDGGTVGNNGDASTVVEIPIVVKSVNDAPTAFALENQDAVNANAGEQIVPLIQITDGDDEIEQVVSVFLSADNSTLFSDLQYEALSAVDGYIKYTPDPGQSGTTLINVLLKDDGGKEDNGVDSVVYSFSVTINPSTGIEQQKNGLKVYPNPANEVLNIETTERINQLSIVSLSGNLQMVKEGNNKFHMEIDISKLTSGFYIVKLKGECGIQSFIFVKH